MTSELHAGRLLLMWKQCFFFFTSPCLLHTIMQKVVNREYTSECCLDSNGGTKWSGRDLKSKFLVLGTCYILLHLVAFLLESALDLTGKHSRTGCVFWSTVEWLMKKTASEPFWRSFHHLPFFGLYDCGGLQMVKHETRCARLLVPFDQLKDGAKLEEKGS